IEVLSESDAEKLPWDELGVDLVIETSNQYTTREGALKHLKESVALYEEFGSMQDIAWSFSEIGRVYAESGNLTRAFEYLEKSLTILENHGSTIDMLEPLLFLISIAIEKRDLEQARHYLGRLKEINEREQNRIIKQVYYVAKALVLKSSTRIKNRGRAQELLEKVVNDEIVIYKLTISALFNLCELLIAELRISGDPEVLIEVNERVTSLFDIAQQQNHYPLLAETYILKSKLALLELDIQRAELFLNQAQQTAEEKGLKRLVIKILSEKDLLQKQINRWKYLIERNAPMSERLELAQLEDRIMRIVRKRMIVTEEETLQYAKEARRVVESWEENSGSE
ncbi:MAG: hypothetical protein ACFFBD_10165, partial [Candidatus Hodarchaeota archaeon]